MGWGERASKWRLGSIWTQIEHPHTAAFGLLSVGVSGLADGAYCEIDLAVGPSGAQQETARLTVRGNGQAIFPEPLNLRDGVAIWFRASDPACRLSIATADIKPAAPRHYRLKCEPAETKATPTPIGGAS